MKKRLGMREKTFNKLMEAVISWLKGGLFLIKQYKKQKKLQSDLYKAQKHAILALAYWKDCEESLDLQFQISESSIYVRLGK